MIGESVFRLSLTGELYKSRFRLSIEATIRCFERRCNPDWSTPADSCKLAVPRQHAIKDMTQKKNVNLEKALADLENLVEDLETGDLPLDKAMKKFEDGIKLTRSCQAALKEAEQKVQILLKSAGGEEVLEDFDPEED